MNCTKLPGFAWISGGINGAPQTPYSRYMLNGSEKKRRKELEIGWRGKVWEGKVGLVKW